jgi:hypothetical protein
MSRWRQFLSFLNACHWICVGRGRGSSRTTGKPYIGVGSATKLVSGPNLFFLPLNISPDHPIYSPTKLNPPRTARTITLNPYQSRHSNHGFNLNQPRRSNWSLYCLLEYSSGITFCFYLLRFAAYYSFVMFSNHHVKQIEAVHIHPIWFWTKSFKSKKNNHKEITSHNMP